MAIGAQEFEYLRKYVQMHSAINIDPDKDYLAESRLSPLLHQEECESVQDLIIRLRKTPGNGLGERVVDAMTNNETWFFRDFNPFEALRNLIIPNLIKKRSSERKIVIWSAACSTGQEPYSIALLLREHFNLPGWRFVVHATDLAATVLAKAQRGRYLQHEVNRGLPATLLAKYFTRVGLEWEVKKEIRDCVDFRPLNLTKPWKDVPPPDVIFLRNVMIYFDLEIRRQILARAHDILRPEGYLFLGGAETTFNLDKRFERMELEKTSCYQIKK